MPCLHRFPLFFYSLAAVSRGYASYSVRSHTATQCESFLHRCQAHISSPGKLLFAAAANVHFACVCCVSVCVRARVGALCGSFVVDCYVRGMQDETVAFPRGGRKRRLDGEGAKSVVAAISLCVSLHTPRGRETPQFDFVLQFIINFT